jgi:NAD(P)-dependent dehydrogenase (short-subunit alcohol dehydrogenase family)
MVSITIKYAADESRYGGYHLYKAAGKLAGKKALISGADPGIGRAIAILYAMEGAESTIIYVPEEEADAQETEKLVQERGGRAHLIQADLTNEQTCKDVVDKAIGYMGRINILVLNHGPEVMKETIEEVTEYTPCCRKLNPVCLTWP